MATIHYFENTSICDTYINPIYNPHPLDDFQKQGCNWIHNNYDLCCFVPTSSGKTLLGKYALKLHTLNKKKVIYTTPIKTLSNEKYNEFRQEFSDTTIGLMTGDRKINPDASVIIMTAEILLNIINNSDKYDLTADFLNNIGCIVMDEVHFMNDTDRGYVWEETIIKLQFNVQLIMLSATVGNVHEFSNWIFDLRKNNLGVINLTKRLIPLKHYLFVKSNELVIDENNNFILSNYNKQLKISNDFKKTKKPNQPLNTMTSLCHYLKTTNNFPAIIFSFSRNLCEKYIKDIKINLLNQEEYTDITRYIHLYFKTPNVYETLDQYKDMMFYLEYGLAFHHSGLLPIFREFIEILFKNKLIKLLFATDTFATGVNTPTKCVVITDIYKFKQGKKQLLTPNEYKQISGRAGRRGIDTTGTIILFPIYDIFESNDLQMLITQPDPINSKFAIDINFCLRYINLTQEIINKSLLFKQNLIKLESIVSQIKDIDIKLFKIGINDIPIEDKTEIDKYIKLKQMENINITINIKNINKLLQNPDNKLYYDTTLLIDSLIASKKSLLVKYNLYNYSSIANNIVAYLEKFDYINANKLTIKGVIANKISECDCIILTEILFSDILTDMDTINIIALFALFIETKSEEKYKTKLDNKLQLIELLITTYKCDITPNTAYVNLALEWITSNTYSLLYEYNEYIGDFVKNIIKLNNIINDVKYIANIINKHELILKLNNSSEILLKSFINLNSLYI
jgi:superfamily II RNA helicase